MIREFLELLVFTVTLMTIKRNILWDILLMKMVNREVLYRVYISMMIFNFLGFNPNDDAEEVEADITIDQPMEISSASVATLSG